MVICNNLVLNQKSIGKNVIFVFFFEIGYADKNRL